MEEDSTHKSLRLPQISEQAVKVEHPMKRPIMLPGPDKVVNVGTAEKGKLEVDMDNLILRDSRGIAEAHQSFMDLTPTISL